MIVWWSYVGWLSFVCRNQKEFLRLPVSTCSIVFRYFLPASIGLIGWNNLREVDYLFLRSWHSLLTTQRLEVILKSMFASGWIKSNTISWLIPSPKSFNINLNKKYSQGKEKEEEKWIILMWNTCKSIWFLQQM